MNSLQYALEKSWSKETSSDPANWTPESPAWGQCAVTVLVQQLYEGGIISRAIVNDDPKNSHYYLDNHRDDYTAKQFPKGTKLTKTGIHNRSDLLSNTSTKSRFDILDKAVKKILGIPPRENHNIDNFENEGGRIIPIEGSMLLKDGQQVDF